MLDRKDFQAVETALHLLREVINQSQGKFEYLMPELQKKYMIDCNTGSDYIRTHSFIPEEVYSKWQKEAAKFKEIKQQYHLYD